MWTFAYRILELIQPGSFSAPQALNPGSGDFSFLYYSLVTLTTLGYGDITPATTAAKVFSSLEAVIGQLYLVITVAWLVGMHVSKSVEKKSQ